MARHYWLLKSEPNAYPYAQLATEKRTDWTGIRNYEARNNLRAMAPGDLALYYHSGEGKEIVGVARIASEPGTDPTAPGEDWASVEIEPVTALHRPVSLIEIRANKRLKTFALVTRGRLSILPVSPEHFELILELGQTRMP